MDNIWDGNPLKSEVIGRCGRDEKTDVQEAPTQLNENNLGGVISEVV